MPPFVLIAVAFAVGIGLSELIKCGSGLVGIVFATAIFFLLGGIWAYIQGKRYSLLWLLLCFLSLGFVWMEVDRVSYPVQLDPFLENYVQVEGFVEELPTLYPNRSTLVLKDPVVVHGKDRWQGKGKLQGVFYFPTDILEQTTDNDCSYGGDPTRSGSTKFSDLLPGTKVRFKGYLDRVPKSLSPGELDYRLYLERRGIIAQIKADEEPEIISEKPHSFKGFWAGVRLRIKEGISSSLPEEQSLFLQGLLLGSKEGMTPDDRDLYQSTGVMHLFAVSGLHLGFVFAALLALSGYFCLKRIPTLLMVTAGIWSYAALIGFTSPITRAAVMATVGLAAYLWQQRRHAINSLALAALVLLLFSPWLLFDSGFQLSFVATWGIIYLAVPLGRYLPLGEGWREMLTVPLAAQLAILPLTALYFQRVAFLGLLANIIVIPLAGMVVYLGLAGILLTLIIPGVTNVFFLIAGALFQPIKGLLEIISCLPGAAFFVPLPPCWLYLLWFLLLGVLGWSLREGFTVSFPHFHFRSRASRWILPSLLVLICCLFLLCTGVRLGGAGKLEIIFFDVGQGDSILVKTPSGRTMLVDAGGSPEYMATSFDPGREIVVPALAEAGVRELDLLVNSHHHEDHLGGIPAVLDNLRVSRYVASPDQHNTPLVIKVREMLDEKKIPVSYVKSGAEILLDPEVKISVLGPPETLFSGTRSDANNNSIILHLLYKEVSIMLTGDLEQEGIEDLLERFPGKNQLQASLLKCPHHGSPHSICPEFARLTSPQLVVISVGRNSFGHPDPRTIELWQEQGARIMRTDQEGHIRILTDGSKLILDG